MIGRVTGHVDFGQFHLSGFRCQRRRSTQHFVEVYSLEFGILKFFWDADLTAAPLGPDPLAYSRTGQFSSGSIAPGADCVFVGAPLPGTLWIAEVDLPLRGYRKLLVLGTLQSAIPGQRTFERRRKFSDR